LIVTCEEPRRNIDTLLDGPAVSSAVARVPLLINPVPTTVRVTFPAFEKELGETLVIDGLIDAEPEVDPPPPPPPQLVINAAKTIRAVKIVLIRVYRMSD
jgi:hypothetical protein